MTRFFKFLILAVIGFAMGGALAYFQQDTSSAPVTAVTTASDATIAAPEMPAVEESAEDVVVATPDAHAGHNHATSAASAGGVAGSSVGGTFSLVDFDGNPVTEKSWPGKLKLVFFGFTSCPDICPAALTKITAALEILKTDKIQPVFITVDPARDTGEVMKAYLSGYVAGIIGLTGDDEALKQAREAYKVYAAKGEKDEHGDHYNVDHSGYIYLIGENESLLEIFGSSDSGETIAGKIRPHVADAPAVAPVTDEGVDDIDMPPQPESAE